MLFGSVFSVSEPPLLCYCGGRIAFWWHQVGNVIFCFSPVVLTASYSYNQPILPHSHPTFGSTWSFFYMRSHGLQPTRLLHPWDFPGKSTGVGCHCLLQLYLFIFGCAGSCCVDRAAWQAAIHRATESDISECHKGQAIWVTATRMLRWPRLALFHRCSTLLFTGHIVTNAEKVQV